MNHSRPITIRNAIPEDYSRIVEVMIPWWGGRDLTSGLSKLTFIYFGTTCFVAECGGELAGFLTGWVSQVDRTEAYVQLSAVNPLFRRRGVGRRLYSEFFNVCGQHGVCYVRACTSPINRLSIRFHQGIGFHIEPGDCVVDGFEAQTHFLRENDPKVVFRKTLRPEP